MKSVAQVLYRRLRATSALVSFSPSSLFASGEQGVWLDNSDFTALFQDAAGTTPVTGYEQFVGLRLDKSRGLVLGPELVTNGDFATDANWVKGTGWTISGGAANYDGTDAPNAMYQTAAVLAAGKSYRVSITVTLTQGSLLVRPSFNASAGQYQITSSGTYPILLSGQGGSFGVVAAFAGARFIGSIDNISVRELPGNHAYQTATTARAVLSARYNLLAHSEDQSNAAWVNFASTQQSNVGVAPNGTNTADRIVEVTGFSAQARYQAVAGGLNIPYTVSAYAKADQRNVFNLSYSGQGSTNWFAATFDLTGSGAVTKTGSGVSGAYINASITSVGDGWYFCQVIGTTGQASAHYVYPGPSDTNNPTYQAYGVPTYNGNSANGILVWGLDVRPANESPALPVYQRVGAAVNGTSTSIGTPDYDTVGFPAYLRYDGGDWYQTNSIDFSTGATNPPLGPELVTNGDFSNGTTGWALTGPGSWSVSSGVATINSASTGSTLRQTIASVVVGRWYAVSYDIVSVATNTLRMDVLGSGANWFFYNPGVSGRRTVYVIAQTNVFEVAAYGNSVVSFDNITVKELTDANYAPDKMSVFAGVRKLSDAGLGIVAELSASASANNGSFNIFAPSGIASPDFYFSSRGTIQREAVYNNGSVAAPVTAILSGIADIGGDIAALRVNGLQVAQSTADQGTGTFGNYPLYIGARGGTSLFFTGRDYGLIIVGRAVTAAELANTENYMETQTFGKDMNYFYADELTTATGDFITAADGDPIYMSVTYA